MIEDPPRPSPSSIEQRPTGNKPTAAFTRDQVAGPKPLAMHYCPNCSQRLTDRGCKLRCERCGYFMDCSEFY